MGKYTKIFGGSIDGVIVDAVLNDIVIMVYDEEHHTISRAIISKDTAKQMAEYILKLIEEQEEEFKKKHPNGFTESY